MMNNVNFVNRNEFFTVDFGVESENVARRKLFNEMVKEIELCLANGKVNNDTSIWWLESVCNNIDYSMRADFFDLWRDELFAPICYAKKLKTEFGEAVIIAFATKGVKGTEITVYEF